MVSGFIFSCRPSKLKSLMTPMMDLFGEIPACEELQVILLEKPEVDEIKVEACRLHVTMAILDVRIRDPVPPAGHGARQDGRSYAGQGQDFLSKGLLVRIAVGVDD
jgi:hypothetical protein